MREASGSYGGSLLPNHTSEEIHARNAVRDVVVADKGNEYHAIVLNRYSGKRIVFEHNPCILPLLRVGGN